jgi:hypothetical protein
VLAGGRGRISGIPSTKGAKTPLMVLIVSYRLDLARKTAAEIGVDRLCWEVTDHPEDAFSRRFGPGAPDLEAIRREVWDDNNLGNAIPGATPRAKIDIQTLVPECR